jgi:NADH:ubiquinone oxidoreductase subunit 6 (subunit J)
MGLTYAALTYVLVYVGAIAILFLFVVQLLDQRNLDIESSELDKKNKSRVLQESKFKSL